MNKERCGKHERFFGTLCRALTMRRMAGCAAALLCLAMVLPAVWAAESTTMPVSKMGEEWWAKRHQEVNARVQKGNVDLIFIGDSITQGWEGDGKEVWDRYYAPRNAVDLGFSGDRTQHVLWRLDNGNIDGISPKAAVLMIGTNNFEENSAEEIGAGIAAIIEELRAKLPNTKVLVLAVFPRGEKPSEVRDKLTKASSIAAAKADGAMVHFLDIGPRFLEADGAISKEIMPDFLHLTRKGYTIWAEAVEPKLAELLGEPALPAGPPPGFVALFDGKDLTGWKGLVEDPEKRAKMTPEELAKAQEKADQRMREHWKAEDGALAFDGKGDSLCTAKDYGDFELLVDWKIGAAGDSGIYLRGSPQVQIWDPAKYPEGSGGLYNNEKEENPKKPLKCADKPIGEWNTFRIRMVGERVTVHLNDALVVNNVVLENYWDRSKPIYPVGQIELQNHSAPLWFRNVFVRELPRVGAVQYGSEEGFAPLFDGSAESLAANWTTAGNRDAWKVEDGLLRTDGVEGGDWLRTKQEYADFVLRMEWMVPEYGNSGVGIHGGQDGISGGCEVQILAPWDPYRPDLNCTGSLYGLVPVQLRPDETPRIWHSFEITCAGGRITIFSDDVKCIDVNAAETPSLKDLAKKGYVSLQSCHTHAGEKWVKFRNIRVKELR